MMKLKLLTLSGMMLCLSQYAYAIELQSDKQKFSYTIGTKVGQMLITQGIDDVDSNVLAAAISDILEKKELQLSADEMREALLKQQQKAKEKRDAVSKENLTKGEKFRQDNAKLEGVTVLDNGLQYEVLTAGEGESPKAEDRVKVHYSGKLIDGTVFDSSIARGEPTQFSLNGVVPGFREAITRMKPGAKWRVVMPPELAYGERGAGKKIGPNETLIFEIEYLGVVPAPEPASAPQTK